MKLHLPLPLYKALCASFAVVASLGTASWASMITPDGRTNTSVIQNGSTYDVYTGTVKGNTGFNSFHNFDVYQGNVANLHLANGTANLINVIRDKVSNIDGVLNAYKEGKIGGNIFMLNPNGIIVGASGVVNAGSITMSTPTAHFIEQLIARDGGISDAATRAVLDGDMPINPEGLVSIKGRLNASHAVAIKSGSAEISGTIRTGVTPSELVNTGARKIDNKNISIKNGMLSIGVPAAKISRDQLVSRKSKANSSLQTESAHKSGIAVEAVKDIRLAGSAILDTSSTGDAGQVTLKAGGDFLTQKGVLVNATSSGDGSGGFVTVCAKGVINLDGATIDVASANGVSGLIYMDPDIVNITGESSLGGDVRIEARVINVDGVSWSGSSFALNAGNVFGSEVYQGDVSINIRNSNLRADKVSLTATATLDNTSSHIFIDSLSSLTGKELTVTSSSLRATAGLDVNGRLTGDVINLKSAGTKASNITIGSSSIIKGLKANDNGNAINIMTSLQGDDKWEKTVDGVIDIKGRIEVGRASGDEDNLGDIDIKSAGDISLADGAVLAAPSGNNCEAGSIEMIAKGNVTIGSATLDVHGPGALADGTGAGGMISIAGGKSVTINGANMNASTNFNSVAGSIDVHGATLTLGSMTLSGDASFSGHIIEIKNAKITNTAGYKLGFKVDGDFGGAVYKDDLFLRIIQSQISADALSFAGNSKIDANDYVTYDEATGKFISTGTPDMFHRDVTIEMDEGSTLTGNLMASITADNDYGASIIRLNGNVHAGQPLIAGQDSFIQQSLEISATASGNALVYLSKGNYTSALNMLISAKSFDGLAQTMIGSADSSAVVKSGGVAMVRSYSGIDADVQILGESRVDGRAIGIYTHSSGESTNTNAERHSTITIGEKATVIADADGVDGVVDIGIMSTFAVHDPSSPDDGISTAPVSGVIHMDGSLNVRYGEGVAGSVLLNSQGDIVLGENSSINTSYGDPNSVMTGSVMVKASGDLFNHTGDIATGSVSLGGDKVTITKSEKYDADHTITGNEIIIGDNVTLDAGDHRLKLEVTNSVLGWANITIGNNCTFIGGTIDIFAEGAGVAGFINWVGSSHIKIGNNFSATASSGDINITSKGIGCADIQFGSDVRLDAAGNLNLLAEVTHGFAINISYAVPIPNAEDISVDWFEALKLVAKIKKSAESGKLSVFTPALAVGLSDASISFADAANKSSLIAREGSVSIQAKSTAKDASFLSPTTTSINVGVGVGVFDTKIAFGKNVEVRAAKDISIKSTNSSSLSGMMNAKTTQESKIKSCVTAVFAMSRINNTISFDSSDSFVAGGNIDVAANTDYSLSAMAEASATQDAYGAVGLGIGVLSQHTSITAPCSFESGGKFSLVSNVSGDVSTGSSGSVSYKKEKAKPQGYQDSKALAVVKIIFNIVRVPWVNKIVDTIEESEIKKAWDKIGGNPNIGQGVGGIDRRDGFAAAGALSVQVVDTSSIVHFSGTLKSGGDATIKATNKGEYVSFAKSSMDQAAAKRVGAFAVNWSNNNTTATATIANGSVIDCAGKLALNSSVELPFRHNYLNFEKIYDFIAKNKYDQEGAAGVFRLVLGSLVNWEEAYDSGNAGLQEAFANSWTSTGNTTHQKVKDGNQGGALSVNLNVANFTQTSEAIIEDGVKINQRHLSASPGSVDVSSKISGTLVNFVGSCPLNLSLEDNKKFWKEKSPNALLMSNDPVACGIGASIGVYLYDNKARASIGAAEIDASSLSVKADNNVFALSVAMSGGSAVSGGAEGNFSLLNVANVTNASVSSNAVIALKSSGLSILANDSSTMINLAGEVFSSNGVSVGVGVAVTKVKSATQAVLGGIDAASLSDEVLSLYDDDKDMLSTSQEDESSSGSITLAGPLNISATNGTTFVALGIAGTKASASGEAGESNYGVAVSANVGVNLYDGFTNAGMRNVNILGQSGANLNLLARNAATIIAMGGAVAIEWKEKGAAVGGTFTWNQVNNNANVFIDNVHCLDGALLGDVKAEAKNESLIISGGMGFSITKVSNAGKSVAVAAVASVNRSNNHAHATIKNSSLNARNLSLLAEGYSNAYAVGVAASVSGVAVGAVVSINTLGNETISSLENSTLTLGGNANIEAKSTGGGLGIAVGGSVATSVAGGSTAVAVHGTATHMDIGNTTRASITGSNTLLTLGGGLNVLATDDSSFSFYNVGMAISLNVGIGAAYTMVNINNNVEALIEDAKIKATGDVNIKSREKAYAYQLEIAGSGGKSVGIAGGVGILNIGNNVSTTVRNTQIETRGKFIADSENTSESYLLFADVSYGNTAGIGGEVGVLNLHNTAKITLDHSLVAAFAGTDLRSYVKDEAKVYGATAGLSGKLGIAASILRTQFNSGSDIQVTSSGIGNVLKNGKVSQEKGGGGLGLSSTMVASNKGIVGAVALGIGKKSGPRQEPDEEDQGMQGLAAAASIASNSFSDYSRINVTNSQVNVQGDINVESEVRNQLDMNLASVGVAGLGALAGNVGVYTNTSKNHAIIENSTLASRGNVNVKAKTSTSYGTETSPMISGGVGIGIKGAGMGGNAGVNYIDTVTQAIIKNSDVRANGDLSVKSDSISLINSASLGVGIGGKFSLATTIGVNRVFGESTAMIVSDDMKRHSVTANSLSVLANTDVLFRNILTTVDGSLAASVGAVVVYNASKGSTTAAISGDLNLDVTGVLQVHANNTRKGVDIANSAGFGSYVSLHGSLSIYDFETSSPSGDISSSLPDEVSQNITSGDQSIFTVVDENIREIDELVKKNTGVDNSVSCMLPEASPSKAGTNAYIDLKGNDLFAGSIDVQANERTSIFQEVGTVSVSGVAAVGVSVAYTRVNSSAQAFIDHASIYTSGDLRVMATHTVSASDVWAVSGSLGVGGGAVAGAFASYEEYANIHAYLGSGTIVNKAKDITIKGIDDVNIRATVGGAACASYFAAGVSHASVGQKGTVEAGLKDGVLIGQSVGGKVNSLTISAEETGKLVARGTAFAGGAVAVDYTRAHAFSSMHLKAYLGDNSRIFLSGSMNIGTHSNYEVSTWTTGISLGGLTVGAIFSDSEVDFDELVSVGNNVTIQARNIDILSSGRSSINAQALPIGVGIVAANGSVAVTGTRGTIKTQLGSNVSLVATRGISIGADCDNKSNALNGGVAIGGIACGSTTRTEAISSVGAQTLIGSGFVARTAGSLDINARTNSHIEAMNNTVYGSLVTVPIAQRVYAEDASSSWVSIGEGQGTSLLEADSISIDAKTQTWIDTKSDQNNYGIVFTYGGAKNELKCATDATLNISGKVDMKAHKASLVASNLIEKPKNSKAIDFDGGGLVSVPYLTSEAEYRQTSLVSLSKGTTIDVSGSSDSSLSIGAINTIKAYDNVYSSSGGLAGCASTTVTTKYASKADVKIDGSTLFSSGDMEITADTVTEITSLTESVSGGVIVGMSDDISMTLNIHNGVQVGEESTIKSERDLTIAAGKSANNTVKGIVNQRLRSFVPGLGGGFAKIALSLDNSVIFANKSYTVGHGVVNVISGKLADTFNVNTEYTYIGLYSSNTDKNKDLSLKEKSTLSVDGMLMAGNYDTMEIWVDTNGLVYHKQFRKDENGNLILQDAQGNRINYDRGLVIAEPNGSRTLVLADGSRVKNVYAVYDNVLDTNHEFHNISSSDVGSGLWEKIQILKTISDNADLAQSTRNQADIQIAVLIGELQALGKWDDVNNVYKPGDKSAIEINGMNVTSGSMNIIAESVVGRGSIAVTGGSIINITSDYAGGLMIDKIGFSDSAPGWLTLNGTRQSNASTPSEFKGTWTTSAGFAFGDGVTITTTNSNSLVMLNGDITNKYGKVNVNSAGSIFSQGSINASEISLTAAGSLIQNSDKYLYFLTSPDLGKQLGEIEVAKLKKHLGDLSFYDESQGSFGTSDSGNNELKENTSPSSFLASGSIFINANYVCLNGTVRSGSQNHSLTVDGTTRVFANNTQMTLDEATAWWKQNQSQSSIFNVVGTIGSSSASFNAATGEIEVASIKNTGGRIEIHGSLLNISKGQGSIEALDGFSNMNITNNTNYTLVMNSADLSQAASGVIKLVDTAKPIYLDGGGINGFETTVYTRVWNADHTAANVIVYSNVAGSTSGISGFQEVSASSVANSAVNWNGPVYATSLYGDYQVINENGIMSAGGYDPLAGLVLEQKAQYKGTYHYSYYPGQSWHEYTLNENRTIVQVVKGEDMVVSSAGAVDNKGVKSQYEMKFDLSSFEDGNIFSHDEYYYNMTATVTHQIKADYNIGVNFIGHADSSASIKSTGNVVFKGNVSTTKSIEASTSGSMEGNGSLSSGMVNLQAHGDIGAQGAINLDQSAGGYVNASSVEGNVNLHSLVGNLHVGTIEAGKGNVNLSALGDVAGYNSQSVIEAKGISVVSGGEVYGYDEGGNKSSLKVRGKADGNGDRSTIVDINAVGSVALSGEGDLGLKTVRSQKGNVTIDIWGGDVFDATKAEYFDPAIHENTDNDWYTNGLISYGGEALDKRVTEFEGVMNNSYKDYMMKDKDGNYVYRDADGNYRTPKETRDYLEKSYADNATIELKAGKLAENDMVVGLACQSNAADAGILLSGDTSSEAYRTTYDKYVLLLGSCTDEQKAQAAAEYRLASREYDVNVRLANNSFVDGVYTATDADRTKLSVGKGYTEFELIHGLNPQIGGLVTNNDVPEGVFIEDHVNISAVSGNVNVTVHEGGMGDRDSYGKLNVNDMKNWSDADWDTLATLNQREVSIDADGVLSITPNRSIVIEAISANVKSQNDLALSLTISSHEKSSVESTLGSIALGLGSEESSFSSLKAGGVLAIDQTRDGLSSSLHVENASASNLSISLASGDINMSATGDLSIDSIKTAGDVILSATGSILGANSGSTINAGSGDVTLSAAGSVGTEETPLDVNTTGSIHVGFGSGGSFVEGLPGSSVSTTPGRSDDSSSTRKVSLSASQMVTLSTMQTDSSISPLSSFYNGRVESQESAEEREEPLLIDTSLMNQHEQEIKVDLTQLINK